MRRNRLLEDAHAILKERISNGDVVVDATMGNGCDTLFLAELAQEVYAFDIQEKALIETKKRTQNYSNIHYILDSYEHILDYVQDFKAVIFNLGYLPSGNKDITTQADITLKTLSMLIPRMKEDDFIQIICYPGHREGQKESEQIKQMLDNLNPHHFQILITHFHEESKTPPYMMMIYRT